MSDRIVELLNVLLPTGVLADIGCDHGKSGVAALKQGLAKKVIFADISAPSLEKASRLCEKEGLQNVSFVCCDGCDEIEYADTLLIAGMGAKEITNILDKCRFVPKQIVLQPMRNQRELREYLKNDWYIEVDKTVFDKKFYSVLRCSQGKENPDEPALVFGKTDLKENSDCFGRFLDKERVKTNTLLEKSGGNDKIANYSIQIANAIEKHKKR